MKTKILEINAFQNRNLTDSSISDNVFVFHSNETDTEKRTDDLEREVSSESFHDFTDWDDRVYEISLWFRDVELQIERINRILVDLLEENLDKWVAIYDNELIATSKLLNDLMEKVKKFVEEKNIDRRKIFFKKVIE